MLPGQPVVVDIHSVKGIRPRFTVYIGRAVAGTEFSSDSRWANIFPVEKFGEKSLVMYEKYIRDRPRLICSLGSLTNQVLGCWCGDFDNAAEPLKCHGQVLIKLWIEFRDWFISICERKGCPFFKNGFCTYNALGCYVEDGET